MTDTRPRRPPGRGRGWRRGWRRHRGPRSFPGGLAAVRAARRGRALPIEGYAVVDVETTGLRPRLDRVVEVAVVRTDAHGRVVDEWSALVDPGCDPGPSEVHGITAAALREAAPFAEVAPELAARLQGHVLVGHNLGFDAAFLSAEALRMATPSLVGAEPGPLVGGAEPGPPSGTDPVPVAVEGSLRAPAALFAGVDAGLCTLQLSRAVLGRPPDGWSLGSLCTQVGVPLTDPHRALADARATAGLLSALLERVPARPRPFGRRLVAS